MREKRRGGKDNGGGTREGCGEMHFVVEKCLF
jgi:hypothetical protein